MSLTRKILDVFCNNQASDIGIFGSKYNGSSDTSSDTDDIQRGQGGTNTNWGNGWSEAIVTNQAPCLEDMNGVMYVLSYMTKYLYQSGVAEWDASEGYGLYAMTQYGGSLYMSIQTDPLDANYNRNHNPSSEQDWWRKLVFTQPYVAGYSYSSGDLVSYNGRTYKCVSNIVSASSNFVTDFYAGSWDDGNPAGTMLQSIAWNKATNPYHYFDVTGTDAGTEKSISDYGALYEVIGTAYNNCINYSTGTQYGNPASGNFRLPDFRNTFFKNAGSNTRGAGHNASHSHAHNWTSSKNLNHSHTLKGYVAVSPGYRAVFTYNSGNTVTDTQMEGWKQATNPVTYSNVTNSATLPNIPALTLQNQGSGSTPEPNYYGTKILLKY